jgi:hypothetical protein
MPGYELGSRGIDTRRSLPCPARSAAVLRAPRRRTTAGGGKFLQLAEPQPSPVHWLCRLPYVTDHYVGNAVLVRLSRVNPDVLRDLLGMAYKFVTCNAARRSPTRKRR